MKHALKLKHLSMNFGGLKVTNDVSLALPVGARTALIGPNGAGKTTLINLISGLMKPISGQIFLMGDDVTTLPPETRVHLGLIRSFQVTRLFSEMTVADHLSFAIRAQDQRMNGVWRAMTSDRKIQEQGSELIESLGLSGLRNNRVDEIAYGQQRLVEIAIAIAMKPKVLLLDEPAAGIPRDSMDLVLTALNLLPKDLAVIMIDHDMELVRRFAQQIVVLAAGQIIANGTPTEISQNAQVRSAYLGELK
jgi:branched-chain amino acid transport system ATP-binding protein